jgi:hypothetical protein
VSTYNVFYAFIDTGGRLMVLEVVREIALSKCLWFF